MLWYIAAQWFGLTFPLSRRKHGMFCPLHRLLLLLIPFVSTWTMAQSATPDTGFGNNGLVLIENYSSLPDVELFEMEEQPDGKILVMGGFYNGTEARMLAQRFNTNGTLDLSFAENGRYLSPATMGDVYGRTGALRPNGNILLAGQGANGAVLVQLQPNGQLDTQFGANGIAQTSTVTPLTLYDLVLDVDGSAYLTGAIGSNAAICKILPNGSVDHSYATQGVFLLTQAQWPSTGWGLTIVPQGYMILTAIRAGAPSTAWLLAGLDMSGSLLPWFGENGVTSVNLVDLQAEEYVKNILVRPDGSIVAPGLWYHDATWYDFYMAFDANGNIDTSFGNDGYVEVSHPPLTGRNLAVPHLLSDGDLLFTAAQTGSSGLSSKLHLARLNSDGSFEAAFGTNGILQYQRNAIFFNQADMGCLLADGRIAIGSSAVNQGINKNVLVVFELQDLSTAGAADLLQETAVVVYPNPATDRITLSGWTHDTRATVELMDATGRCHKRWRSSDRGFTNNGGTLDLPPFLGTGVYQLILRSGEERIVRPLIIQH